MTKASDSYSMLFNCMIIDPVSKLHVYVLPITSNANTYQIIVPYSTCMILADMYSLHENTTNKEYSDPNVPCVSYRRFLTSDTTEQQRCYNNVDLAKDAIFATYGTNTHEYGSDPKKHPNVVTDILLSQFNRCLALEKRDTNKDTLPKYKPIASIYIKTPTEYDDANLKKLYFAFSDAIMSITVFWRKTIGMLTNPSLIYQHVIRANFMNMLTTVELARLQQKMQYGMKFMRDISCLVIVHDQGKQMYAFCYNINRLVTDQNQSEYRKKILDVADELVKPYENSTRKVDIFYLPALRAYGMNKEKLQAMTSDFLGQCCYGLDIKINGIECPIDKDVVQQIFTKLGHVVIGNPRNDRDACAGNVHLLYNLITINRDHVDTLKALLKMKNDIIVPYFFNIYNAYFVHLMNGEECNRQEFYQSTASIRDNLAATIMFDIATSLHDLSSADKYREQILADEPVYQKIIASINIPIKATQQDFISDTNVLGRCLLYKPQKKNEKLILFGITQADCPLVSFTKKMNTPKPTPQKERLGTISSHSFAGATFHSTATINIAEVKVECNTTNAMPEIYNDIMVLAADIAATIGDRMGTNPSKPCLIPQHEFCDSPHVAQNPPDLAPNKKVPSTQRDTPSTSNQQEPTIIRRRPLD